MSHRSPSERDESREVRHARIVIAPLFIISSVASILIHPKIRINIQATKATLIKALIVNNTMGPISAITAFTSLAAPVASFTAYSPSTQRVAPLGAVNGIWNTGNEINMNITFVY